MIGKRSLQGWAVMMLLAGAALSPWRSAAACQVYFKDHNNPAHAVDFGNQTIPSIKFPPSDQWKLYDATLQQGSVTFDGPDCSAYLNTLVMTKPATTFFVAMPSGESVMVYKFHSDTSSTSNQRVGYILQYRLSSTANAPWQNVPASMPIPLSFSGQPTITVYFRWALAVRVLSSGNQTLSPNSGYHTTAGQVGTFKVDLVKIPVESYPFSFRVGKVVVDVSKKAD